MSETARERLARQRRERRREVLNRKVFAWTVVLVLLIFCMLLDLFLQAHGMGPYPRHRH